MPSLVVKSGNPHLVDFLSEKLSISKKKAKSLIDSRRVFVNNRRIWIARHILNSGDVVEFPEHWELNKEPSLEIIYEDDYIILVNKKRGILSNNGKDSIEEILRREKGDQAIRLIHRLDKDTSGLILLAKNAEVFEEYKKIWKRREVKKTYLAICYGEVDFKEKRISFPLDGKDAVSLVKLLKGRNGFSFFEIEIVTGRKHQVRRHLSMIGHPVVGDKVYGPKEVNKDFLKKIDGQLLHSYRMEFECPLTHIRRNFFAPLPTDFKKFLRMTGMS